jgi:prepilin-type N-terminal cleavage/methylation domain-containing protein
MHMKLLPRNDIGFTLIELLICLVIVGVLLTMVVPVSHHQMLTGEMVGTLSNMRQLHLATAAMTLDAAAKDEGIEWTMLASHGKTAPVSLATYLDALVKNNYLTKADLRKLLSPRGEELAENELTARNIAFKIFQVDRESPSDQPLFITANWEPSALTNDAPYGKKGFVVLAKGGSGGIYKRPNDVTSTNIFPAGERDGHAYRYVTLE